MCGERDPGYPPIKHGLYIRHLKPELQEAFNAAKLDSLDSEIRLAKAKLDWAVKQWQEDPLGGVVTNTGAVCRIQTWDEIVRLHQESVARLTETRAKHCSHEAGSKPLTTHKAWLKARQGKREKKNGQGSETS